MVKHGLLCACLLFAAHGIATADIVENFDNISTLTAAGWSVVNNSAPLGSTNWFQGNSGIFPSQAGAPESYIAANFNAAASGGNISDWLMSPEISLSDTQLLRFYTRTETASGFADRLELRLSVNGASTNVGASDSSVGDFNLLMLTINPTLDPTGYPDAWTEVSVVFGGLASGTQGRFAFRYTVPDTNTNGDYIGIDSLTMTAVPEPAAIVCLATVLAGIALRRRAHSRIQ